MTKRQKLTPAAKPATKKRTSAKGKAVTAPPVHPHAIDIGPYVRPVAAIVPFARRRLLALSALLVLGLSANHYDTQDVRGYAKIAPMAEAMCERDMYVAGYLRRWGTLDTEAHGARAVAQTVAWTSLAEGFSADCQNMLDAIPLPQRRSVQSWRDWQSRQRTPNAPADPLPQPDASTYQVAYEEGNAP